MTITDWGTSVEHALAERDAYRMALDRIADACKQTEECTRLELIERLAEEALSKRTDYYREQDDDRREWRESLDQACMVCGWRPPGQGMKHLEVHELASRAQAPGKSHARWSYILLCAGPGCHEKVSTIGLPKLLAHKALNDSSNYDRQAVNLARGRDKDAVSEIDVLEQIVNFLKPF